jgi:hypothetical protein
MPNAFQEKEGLSSDGGMSRRDFNAHGGMGICRGCILIGFSSFWNRGRGGIGGDEHGSEECVFVFLFLGAS